MTADKLADPAPCLFIDGYCAVHQHKAVLRPFDSSPGFPDGTSSEPLRAALERLVETWDLYGTTEVNSWGDKAIHEPWRQALKQARAALQASPQPESPDHE